MIVHRLRPRIRKRIDAIRRRRGYRPPTFCLVTGAPRSGTSAMVRWLDGQSPVTALNESRVLVAANGMVREVERFGKLAERGTNLYDSVRRVVFDFYAERSNYTYPPVLVDKEPLEPIAFPDKDYAGFISNMRLAFPEMKLMLMIRDPVATVWSMSQRKWGYSLAGVDPVTYTLEEHVQNWCDCADLVLRLASEAETYVCTYGALTGDPIQESVRIARFLELEGLKPFESRPSDEPAFDPESLALIEAETKGRVRALAAAGLDNL